MDEFDELWDFERLQGKEPYDWSADDLSTAKSLFTRLRPAPPADLTRNLLRYWIQRAPDRSLFDDPEHNLALLLHARAFGSLQDTELPGYLDEILAGSAVGGAALLPGPLAWGPRAALSPSV